MNSDSDRKAIRQMMGEIVNSMTRDEAERDLRKELFKRLKDDYNVEPKVARKVVNAMYKGNFAEEREAYEEVEALYHAIKSIPMIGGSSVATSATGGTVTATTGTVDGEWEDESTTESYQATSSSESLSTETTFSA